MTDTSQSTVLREEHLDPPDWGAFRSEAHEIVDIMIDFLESVRDRPAWQPVPAAAEPRFTIPLPAEGIGLSGAFRRFREVVLPYPTGNIHPRFWGWVAGTGTPSGMLAELLTGAINAVPGNFDDAAARIEMQVLQWMKELMGFPTTASGVITSGGSVANLVGLAAARDAKAGFDVTTSGLQAGPRLVVYVSTEVHSSIDKAAQLLGLGRDAVRRVATDDRYRIRVSEVERAIVEDQARGLRPIAIVGTAGTINTGAVDDLEALSTLARRHDVWLHIDAAYGAMVRLSPHHADLVQGLDLGDSVAFDFHKWMYVPYEAGCVLVRDAQAHRRPFHVPADYLTPLPRGTGSQPDAANFRGLQLSRAFKALKVWLTLLEHGADKLGRMVAQNIAQIEYLGHLIANADELELMTPVALNVACFRYTRPGLTPGQLDEINREILMRLQESGVAVPSGTVLHGRFVFKITNTNQRSRRSDFDILVQETTRLGREVAAERASS